MIQYKLKEKENDVQIHISDFIELLEYKLLYLKQEKEKDSSWNYPIEETEQQLIELKTIYNNSIL
jgi:hypothetical protein